MKLLEAKEVRTVQNLIGKSVMTPSRIRAGAEPVMITLVKMGICKFSFIIIELFFLFLTSDFNAFCKHKAIVESKLSL